MARLPTFDSAIRSVHRRSKHPLARLGEAVRISRELSETGDAVVDHFVEEARRARHSWAEIGSVLGMTKQGAQQRFRARWFDRFARSRGSSRSSDLTDRARESIDAAEEEARRLQHNYLGTEHLLLGLFATKESVAAKALSSLEVSERDFLQMLEEKVGSGGKPVTGSIPFTPRAQKVLELSVSEGLQLGHTYVGTEHILLALSAEGEGFAAEHLRASGVGDDRVRSTVVSILTNRDR